jgi:cobalt/nickel transport system permease protein
MSLGVQPLDFGTLDALAYGDSPVHRLDARTKVLAAAAFVVTVVSFPKYEIGGLIPCFLLPVLAVSVSGVPVAPLLKRLLAASLFAVLLGIFNPLLDTAVMYRIGGVPISAGWVSFASILLKYCLTMSALLALVATTSFPGVARALGRVGVPDVFVCQLVFLYRFLFVLVAEGRRMALARDLRSFDGRGRGLRVTAALLGTLFVRTIERAERVYRAMRSRGFRGALLFGKPERLRAADLACLALTAVLLALFRSRDVVGLIGLRLQALF